MRGFTLIETLVVVTIILTLVSIVSVSYRNFSRQTELQTSAQEIVATLDRARTRTQASRNDSQYGVHLASGSYALFPGNNYDANSPDNETVTLNSRFEIAEIDLAGGGSDIIFDRLTGATAQSGTFSLRLISEPSTLYTIRVHSAGQADLASEVSPTDSRITDTRHVHLELGWSIVGSNTLTLTFSDPPNADVIEAIDMAGYFDGTTDFFWQDTVDINGSAQTLRINAHSLNLSDTLLSIHHDQRLNDKAVAIEIDGQDIISYAADGTATVGDSGGILEMQ